MPKCSHSEKRFVVLHLPVYITTVPFPALPLPCFASTYIEMIMLKAKMHVVKIAQSRIPARQPLRQCDVRSLCGDTDPFRCIRGSSASGPFDGVEVSAWGSEFEGVGSSDMGAMECGVKQSEVATVSSRR